MGKGAKNFIVNRGQGARIATFKRVNNIIDIPLVRPLVRPHILNPVPITIPVNNRSVLLIDHFFEPRFSTMIKYLINVGYIPDTIDIEILNSSSSLEAILDKYYNKGYRLFFGTQKSSVFIGLIPWFEKHSDTLYFNSGATTYTVGIDNFIPDNMIRTSSNILDNVNFIVKKIVYNFHEFFDLNPNSVFNNFFNHVDNSVPNGQVFNQIVYICDSNAVTGTGQNYIDMFNNVINDYCPGAVSFKSFILNVSKDTKNNSFVFNKELDTLLTENPIDGNNFSTSVTKSVFVVKCTNDSNFQTILNYFSKKEYYHNVIIFNEKFLNMNASVPFNSKYELPYSFILSGGFSELGYKLSKKIFGDYNIGGEALSFIDIFTFLPGIYNRVIDAGTPMTKMIEYLTTIGSIDRNEWHVKSSYLYELKNVYNQSTKLFDFYATMKIFRKKFNSDSTGTTPDESWIPTAINSYPGASGAVSYSSNNTNYNNSNSTFINNYLSGVSMLFTTTQEITDYTSQLDSFFKASPYPNATPAVFGIWKCLTNTSWSINSTAISNTIAINVTAPSQALIDGSSCNKNYWLHAYNGPISYTYNSYDVHGTLIGTGSDSVTIDFDMTYSPDNYVVFFDKGNIYNGVRAPLRVHFTLYANQVTNKQYRIGDIITVSSSSLGTNVNASIDSISSDGFTLGVTRFENENTNGITSTVLKQNVGVILSLSTSTSIATMGVNPDITNVANNSLSIWSQNGCYYLALLSSGMVVAYDYRTRLSFWSSSGGFSNPGPGFLRFRVSNNYLIIEVLDTDGTIMNTILNYNVSSNLLVYPLQLTITNDRDIAIINANGDVLWSEQTRVRLSLANGDTISNSLNYGSMYSLNGTYNLALDATGLLSFSNLYGNAYNISTISQGWSAVYNQFENNTSSYAWNNYKWIWNMASSSTTSVPVGTVNFYTTYTNTRTTDITATLYYSVDDTLDVYMNGIKLTSSTVPYNVVWAVTITLKAGSTSNFKFVATNTGGPAGLIFWCLENGNTNDATNTLFFSNNTNTNIDSYSLYSISNSTATSLNFSYTNTTGSLTFALGLYNSYGNEVYDILKDGSFLKSTTFDSENNKLIELSFVAPYTCKLSNNGDLVIVDANNNKYWALGKADKTTVTQDSYSIVNGVSTLTNNVITGISAVGPRQGDYATIHNPVNPLYSGTTATISKVNSDKSITVSFYDEDDANVRSKILKVRPDLRSQLVTDSGDTRGQNVMPVSDFEMFNLTSTNGYFSAYIGNDCIVRVKDNRTGRQMWMSSSLALGAGQTIRKCNGLKIDNDTGALYVDVINENLANSTSNSQTVILTAKINYTLEFYASGNTPITVTISPSVSNPLQPLISFTFTPINGEVTLFTQSFSTVTTGTFVASFSSNFPNISINNEDKYYLVQNAGDNTSSYSLNMQDDGNLCLYKNASNGTVTGLWCTMAWQTDSWKSTDGVIQAFQYQNQYVPPRLTSNNGLYHLSIDDGKLSIMTYTNGGYNLVNNSSFKYIGKPFFYTGQPGVGVVGGNTIYASGTLWQNYSNWATGGYWNSFYNNVMNSFSFSNSDGYNLVDKVSPIWVSPNSTTSGGSSGTYDFYYTYTNTTGKTISSTLWVSVLEKCDVYINNVYIRTVGGTSSSSWTNFSSFDLNLQPGNNTFNFLKTYNSGGRCGLVFMCFPKYISSCDLLFDNTGDANGFGRGNLLVRNVSILAEDGTTVNVPGISDLNPYAITNFKNSGGDAPFTMSFQDDGYGGSDGTFIITNSAGASIFSTNASPSGVIDVSLPGPDDRRGILNSGVKLHAQYDESELNSFLWSPSGYSFFGVYLDTVANTQTICIFDARFTKPVYTFYTNSYTTLTSDDAISYLMLSTSGAIVAYNLLGSVLWKTADISGYSNYRLTIDDSNMLSIIANNSSGSPVTLATYLQTWGTFGNSLLSIYTGAAYYGRVLTSSSGDYILSLDNGSLNINNVIDTSYNSSSSSSSHVKDIYNYTLYTQLYTYTGSNPSNVHVRLMPNGTYIVCEWPTSYLMWGDWFYAYPGIPPQSYNRLNDGNWVYMYYDGTYTKMVTDTGEARYYVGTISSFNSNNWSTYSLAYDSASQQSHYKLNLVPLRTFGTPNVGIPGYKLILGNTGELAIYDSSIPRAAATDCCSVSAGWTAVYNQFKNNTSSYGYNNYRWIWNAENSAPGGPGVPVGTVNFYTTYTNTRTTDITATLYYSVDDSLNVYMNGNKLTSSTVPYNVVWAVTITLKAGTTSLFKFVATNGGGPAGLIFWCLENGNTNDATNTLFFSNPNTVYCSDGIYMYSDEFGIQTWTSGTSYSETIPYPNYTIDTSDIPENMLVSSEFTFKIPSSDSDTDEYTKIYSQNRLYYLRFEQDGSLAIYLSISGKRIWSNGRPYSGTNNAARICFVYESDGNGTFGLFDSKGLSYGNTIPVLKSVLYAFYLGNDRILRLIGSNGTTVVFNP